MDSVPAASCPPGRDYALFIFSDQGQTDWHFLNVKFDEQAERRQLYRRITIKPGAGLRTATERVQLLDLAEIHPELFGITPLAIQQRCDAAFDVETVTKDFFTEVANWYFWALKNAKFPKDAPKEADGHDHISIIRLITRLIFCWFVKEKGLIPDTLFDQKNLAQILTGFEPAKASAKQSVFYKAILQNLFFATLNTEMDKRAWRKEDANFMAHILYRHKTLFQKPGEALALFKDIPFLNGGLFECLDKREGTPEKPKDIRIDGFSDRSDSQPTVPDFLFFGPKREVDLSAEYDDKKFKSVSVRGLIHIFNRYNFTVEEDTPIDQEVALDPELSGKVFENLLAAYNPETGATARKQTGSFYTPREIVKLKADIEHDLRLLKKILELVMPITPEQDAKLQKLKSVLAKQPLKDGKRLIFTQYADTARYLHDNLNPGGKRDDIDVIFSGDKSKARIVGRFAPKANPEYQFTAGEKELFTVIATDVLAEGLNLQDCDNIINYDLHWNPVRLIQRFGRIDRIGSDHDVVHGFNFLPETELDKHLDLKDKLHNRIQEIHDSIGEDSEILDRTEKLNEEAMYAIYEKKGGQLNLFEDEEDEFLDLNEAEEILRQLRKENPAEYERIADLRDGIRAAKTSTLKGQFVFCEAAYPDGASAKSFQQLFLLDASGAVVSKEVPRILGAIKCGPELKSQPLPQDYNAAVMRVQRQFAEEVKHRQAERSHTLSLSHGQNYILRELRVLFGASTDDDQKAMINVLEKSFRGPITRAVNREVVLLRRNGVSGEPLLKALARIYDQHNLRDWVDRRGLHATARPVPKIVCSEALV